MFGNAASQPAQQSTNGMFPPLGQSIGQSAGGSLFGGQQQQGQQQGQTQPEASGLGQSKGPGSLQAAYFDQILERGRKRNNQENGSGLGDLPSLQLGLGDIARKVRNLGTGGPSAEHAKAGDSRAYVSSLISICIDLLIHIGTTCSPRLASPLLELYETSTTSALKQGLLFLLLMALFLIQTLRGLYRIFSLRLH